MVFCKTLNVFMLFDFKHFSEQAQSVYQMYESHLFELDEVLDVFHYYFEEYECKMHRPHPDLNNRAIIKILDTLPCLYDLNFDKEIYLSVDDYRRIIKAHFSTEYRFTDYNILHFFSGRIRLLRFYETQRNDF